MNVLLPEFGKPTSATSAMSRSSSSSQLLLSTLPLLGERRRSPRVGEEPCVAPSASASCRGEPAIAMVDEVGEQRATFHRSHGGALRHGDNRVLAPGAVASLARAVGAVGRPPVGMVAERQQ